MINRSIYGPFGDVLITFLPAHSIKSWKTPSKLIITIYARIDIFIRAKYPDCSFFYTIVCGFWSRVKVCNFVAVSHNGKPRTRGWIVRERGLEEVNANRNKKE